MVVYLRNHLGTLLTMSMVQAEVYRAGELAKEKLEMFSKENEIEI